MVQEVAVKGTPVVDFVTQVPRYPVMPTVSGTPTTYRDFNAGASNLFIGVRAVVGAYDDADAAERLASLTNGARQCGPADAIVFKPDQPVSQLDVVGVMNGSATSGLINHTDTVANAIAQKTRFDFSTPADVIVLTLLPAFNSGQECQLHVEAYANEI